MYFENTNSPLQLNNSGINLESMIPFKEKAIFNASCPLNDVNADVYSLLLTSSTLGYKPSIKFLQSSVIVEDDAQNFVIDRSDISVLTTGKTYGNMMLKGVPNEMLNTWVNSLYFSQPNDFTKYKPSNFNDNMSQGLSLEYPLSKEVAKTKFSFDIYPEDNTTSFNTRYNTRMYVDNSNSLFRSYYYGTSKFYQVKLNDTGSILNLTDSIYEIAGFGKLTRYTDGTTNKLILLKNSSIIDGTLVVTDYSVYNVNVELSTSSFAVSGTDLYIKYTDSSSNIKYLKNFISYTVPASYVNKTNCGLLSRTTDANTIEAALGFAVEWRGTSVFTIETTTWHDKYYMYVKQKTGARTSYTWTGSSGSTLYYLNASVPLEYEMYTIGGTLYKSGTMSVSGRVRKGLSFSSIIANFAHVWNHSGVNPGTIMYGSSNVASQWPIGMDIRDHTGFDGSMPQAYEVIRISNWGGYMLSIYNHFGSTGIDAPVASGGSADPVVFDTKPSSISAEQQVINSLTFNQFTLYTCSTYSTLSSMPTYLDKVIYSTFNISKYFYFNVETLGNKYLIKVDIDSTKTIHNIALEFTNKDDLVVKYNNVPITANKINTLDYTNNTFKVVIWNGVAIVNSTITPLMQSSHKTNANIGVCNINMEIYNSLDTPLDEDYILTNNAFITNDISNFETSNLSIIKDVTAIEYLDHNSYSKYVHKVGIYGFEAAHVIHKMNTIEEKSYVSKISLGALFDKTNVVNKAYIEFDIKAFGSNKFENYVCSDTSTSETVQVDFVGNIDGYDINGKIYVPISDIWNHGKIELDMIMAKATFGYGNAINLVSNMSRPHNLGVFTLSFYTETETMEYIKVNVKNLEIYNLIGGVKKPIVYKSAINQIEKNKALLNEFHTLGSDAFTWQTSLIGYPDNAKNTDRINLSDFYNSSSIQTANYKYPILEGYKTENKLRSYSYSALNMINPRTFNLAVTNNAIFKQRFYNRNTNFSSHNKLTVLSTPVVDLTNTTLAINNPIYNDIISDGNVYGVYEYSSLSTTEIKNNQTVARSYSFNWIMAQELKINTTYSVNAKPGSSMILKLFINKDEYLIEKDMGNSVMLSISPSGGTINITDSAGTRSISLINPLNPNSGITLCYLLNSVVTSTSDINTFNISNITLEGDVVPYFANIDNIGYLTTGLDTQEETLIKTNGFATVPFRRKSNQIREYYSVGIGTSRTNDGTIQYILDRYNLILCMNVKKGAKLSYGLYENIVFDSSNKKKVSNFEFILDTNTLASDLDKITIDFANVSIPVLNGKHSYKLKFYTIEDSAILSKAITFGELWYAVKVDDNDWVHTMLCSQRTLDPTMNIRYEYYKSMTATGPTGTSTEYANLSKLYIDIKVKINNTLSVGDSKVFIKKAIEVGNETKVLWRDDLPDPQLNLVDITNRELNLFIAVDTTETMYYEAVKELMKDLRGLFESAERYRIDLKVIPYIYSDTFGALNLDGTKGSNTSTVVYTDMISIMEALNKVVPTVAVTDPVANKTSVETQLTANVTTASLTNSFMFVYDVSLTSFSNVLSDYGNVNKFMSASDYGYESKLATTNLLRAIIATSPVVNNKPIDFYNNYEHLSLVPHTETFSSIGITVNVNNFDSFNYTYPLAYDMKKYTQPSATFNNKGFYRQVFKDFDSITASFGSVVNTNYNIVDKYALDNLLSTKTNFYEFYRKCSVSDRNLKNHINVLLTVNSSQNDLFKAEEKEIIKTIIDNMELGDTLTVMYYSSDTLLAYMFNGEMVVNNLSKKVLKSKLDNYNVFTSCTKDMATIIDSLMTSFYNNNLLANTNSVFKLGSGVADDKNIINFIFGNFNNTLSDTDVDKINNSLTSHRNDFIYEHNILVNMNTTITSNATKLSSILMSELYNSKSNSNASVNTSLIMDKFIANRNSYANIALDYKATGDEMAEVSMVQMIADVSATQGLVFSFVGYNKTENPSQKYDVGLLVFGRLYCIKFNNVPSIYRCYIKNNFVAGTFAPADCVGPNDLALQITVQPEDSVSVNEIKAADITILDKYISDKVDKTVIALYSFAIDKECVIDKINIPSISGGTSKPATYVEPPSKIVTETPIGIITYPSGTPEYIIGEPYYPSYIPGSPSGYVPVTGMGQGHYTGGLSYGGSYGAYPGSTHSVTIPTVHVPSRITPSPYTPSLGGMVGNYSRYPDRGYVGMGVIPPYPGQNLQDWYKGTIYQAATQQFSQSDWDNITAVFGDIGSWLDSISNPLDWSLTDSNGFAITPVYDPATGIYVPGMYDSASGGYVPYLYNPATGSYVPSIYNPSSGEYVTGVYDPSTGTYSPGPSVPASSDNVKRIYSALQQFTANAPMTNKVVNEDVELLMEPYLHSDPDVIKVESFGETYSILGYGAERVNDTETVDVSIGLSGDDVIANGWFLPRTYKGSITKKVPVTKPEGNKVVCRTSDIVIPNIVNNLGQNYSGPSSNITYTFAVTHVDPWLVLDYTTYDNVLIRARSEEEVDSFTQVYYFDDTHPIKNISYEELIEGLDLISYYDFKFSIIENSGNILLNGSLVSTGEDLTLTNELTGGGLSNVFTLEAGDIETYIPWSSIVPGTTIFNEASVNGKEPFDSFLSGKENLIVNVPYVTLPDHSKNFRCSVNVIGENNKIVAYKFLSNSSDISEVNGDKVEFSSNELFEHQIASDWIAPPVDAAPVELTTLEPTEVSVRVYNPKYNAMFKSQLVGKDYDKIKVTVDSDNNNIKILDKDIEVQFGEDEEYKDVPVKVQGIKDATSSWHPKLHSGYYYVNNLEHFMYSKGTPLGDYKLREDYKQKDVVYVIECTIQNTEETLIRFIEENTKNDFLLGSFGNTEFANKGLQCSIGEDGNYIAGEYISRQIYLGSKPSMIGPTSWKLTKPTGTDAKVYLRTYDNENVGWGPWVRVLLNATPSVIASNIIQYKVELTPVNTTVEETTMEVDSTLYQFTGTCNNVSVEDDKIALIDDTQPGVYTSGVYSYKNPILEYNFSSYGVGEHTILVSASDSLDEINNPTVWTSVDMVELGKLYYRYKVELNPGAVVYEVRREFKYNKLLNLTPTLGNIKLSALYDPASQGIKITKTNTTKVAADGELHQITEKNLLNTMFVDITGKGYRLTDVSLINVYANRGIELSYETSGNTNLWARTTEVEKEIVKSKYFNFINGECKITPIPQQYSPVIVCDENLGYLNRVNFYDDKYQPTLTNKEVLYGTGRKQIMLTYTGIDINSLKVKVDSIEIDTAALRLLNNVLVFEEVLMPTNKIEVEYKISNSFNVNYNYDVANDTALVMTHTDYALDKVIVNYEIDKENNSVHAKDININTIYNPFNTGFVYVTDEVNMSNSINVKVNPKVLSASDREYINIYIQALDKYGNPVAGETMIIDVNYGKLTLKSNITDKYGIVSVKYLAPEEPCTDTITVKSLETAITVTENITIVE